ncbi:MAG TPA: methyltransferase domain-containing protein, partial [Alphaproteobacteria bacterium]|nr:methyltransferase domain-containing protein [Alphaproteobacteria bacterium]
MDIDFGRTAADYALYRRGYPVGLYDRLRAGYGIGAAGQRIVDLGTGTGALARGFAQRGALVTGIDPAEALLEQAERADRDSGVYVDYRAGRAEATGLPDAAADVVTAAQCWHWFDRPAAAAEARRLLVSGGQAAIVHFDWLPLPGTVVEATEALILAHNPGWSMGGGTGFYPQWPGDLYAAGFGYIETFSFDVGVEFSPEAWRGRIRASAGVAASLDSDGVARFDAELAALLARDFPQSPLRVPHRAW